MNARILLTLFFMLLLCADLFGQITLDECQQRARENYPLVKQFQLISQSTNLSLENASRNYWPQTSLFSAISYQSAVTSLPIEIPGLNVPTLSKDQYQVNLEASQLIWDGGKVDAQKKQIRISGELEQKQLEADLYQIKSRINELYFGILLFEEQLANNLLLQEELNRNLRRVKEYLKFGIATERDVQELSVMLLEIKQQEDKFISSRNAYLDMLEKFIGIPLPQGISMPNSIPPPQNNSFFRRPEFISLNTSELKLDVERKLADAKILPVINLFARIGYGRPGLDLLKDDFSFYYVGGIRLTWNISALYTFQNDKKMIETARRNLIIAKSVFQFNEDLKLMRLKREWLNQMELLRKDDEIIELRSSICRSSESKLKNGVIDVTDLLKDLTDENMARRNKSYHQIQLLYTLYQMKYVTNE
ncbi:MAG: TolC family protein [Bacteroidales bacterium]